MCPIYWGHFSFGAGGITIFDGDSNSFGIGSRRPEILAAKKGGRANDESTGDFSLTDKAFEEYPNGRVPRPKGPFRILEGEEYESARDQANAANNRMHKQNPTLDGKQIHEKKPVKFGGSPTDPENKVALDPKEHAQYTTFWNRLLRLIRGDK